MLYNYKTLCKDIAHLSPVVIGKSVEGRDIFAVHKGKPTGFQILIHGAIHAREVITSPLVLKMFEDYNGQMGLWCVPMLNPDGVEILSENPLWKANARGVDLNTNFPAKWGTGVQNVRVSGAENYIGKCPASEPEVRAIMGFTSSKPFIATLSYHSKGEEVYWGFDGVYPQAKLTKLIADKMGYELKTSVDSAGGYKDWYVQEFGGMGLTVEVGSDEWEHPIGMEHLGVIYERHVGVLELIDNEKTRILHEKSVATGRKSGWYK